MSGYFAGLQCKQDTDKHWHYLKRVTNSGHHIAKFYHLITNSYDSRDIFGQLYISHKLIRYTYHKIANQYAALLTERENLHTIDTKDFNGASISHLHKFISCLTFQIVIWQRQTSMPLKQDIYGVGIDMAVVPDSGETLLNSTTK